MKLAWMGEYRDVVEKLIRYCNIYAAVYKKEAYRGTDVKISYSQIQVVEYLLENEELHQNMAMIAGRLGITRSAFTKLVNRLAEKGLLEKFHASDNRRDVIVQVTAQGRQVYADYSDYIYREHFSKMFEAGRAIPRESLPAIAAMLNAGLRDDAPQQPCRETPKLIPVKKKAGR